MKKKKSTSTSLLPLKDGKVGSSSSSSSSFESQIEKVKAKKTGDFPLKGKSPAPLTPKEKNVLNFIMQYFLDHGHSPTYQEIKEHLNLASFNSIQNYLKQLQKKNYVQLFPHQKRCIEIVNSSSFLKDKLINENLNPTSAPYELTTNINNGEHEQVLNSKKTDLSFVNDHKLLQNSLNIQKKVPSSPLFELPLLGRVAAGVPIERSLFDETLSVPSYLVNHPDKTYVLKIEGDSMVEDGIFNNDFVLVQQQSYANNGDIVVASVDNESTVKRFYYNFKNEMSDREKREGECEVEAQRDIAETLIELRPANKMYQSTFYPSDRVKIMGVVVGLIRKF